MGEPQVPLSRRDSRRIPDVPEAPLSVRVGALRFVVLACVALHSSEEEQGLCLELRIAERACAGEHCLDVTAREFDLPLHVACTRAPEK